MERGGGFVGIGTAAESEPGSALLDDLIGARPDPASPTGTTTRTLEVGDRVHPSTRDLPLELNRTDIWYRWQTRPTGTVHTVARWRALGRSARRRDVDRRHRPPDLVVPRHPRRAVLLHRHGPDRGQLHRGQLNDAPARRDPVGGRASCAATARRRSTPTTAAPAWCPAGEVETGLATSGESHGITIAPNGWVIYIGRGDCRTDAERGALRRPAGARPHPRPLERERRHRLRQRPRVGPGGVRRRRSTAASRAPARSPSTATAARAASGPTRPTTSSSTACSGSPWRPTSWRPATSTCSTSRPSTRTTLAARAAVRAARLEDVAAAHLALHDRPRRPSSSTSTPRSGSSSTTPRSSAAATSAAAWASTPQGNLYVTTGDTNSSQGTGGYSGNNQPPVCPTRAGRPGVEPALRQRLVLVPGRAPDRGQHQRLQRQDAAVQAGPRRSRTASQPPVGDRHDLHDPRRRRRRTGRTCSTAPRAAAARRRPEIYAMGLRNPSRLSIDPETDVPYTAWVGPDAGAPSATLGPSTYENAAQIDRAGNYGWPFCMGGKQAYRDRVADGTPRTVQRPRLRAGRAGDRRHGRLVRLRQPRQRLDPQHRPDRAPAPDRHRARRGQDAAGTTSGTAAATRTAPTAARSSRARAASTGRPNYGATRASCARTPPPTARRS